MKKQALFAGFFVLLSAALIIVSGFRYFQEQLFYYTFNNEKILLEVVPGKYVLRYSDSSIAKGKAAILARQGLIKAQEWKDARTAIVSLPEKATGNVIGNLQDEADVVSLQPLYRTKAEKMDIAATDEILVQFKKDVATEIVDRTIKIFGLRLKEKGSLFYTFTVPKKANTLAVANAIMEIGIAEFSHPNFYRQIELHQVPNDAYFSYQWNLNNTGQVINDGHTGTPDADIDAPEAWPITMGSSSVVVAVIDEGVSSNHPDLPNTRQVRLNGSNFIPAIPGNDPSPTGNDNHGNACAGIIAATRNNSEGIAGIAPNCKIMPIRIASETQWASDANTANAITFAKANGAHVISNSWGYFNRFGAELSPNLIPAIVTAISDAVTNGRGGLGCIVVFAAGNTANHATGSDGVVSFPSNVNIPGVITVGASDRYDRQATYSPTTDVASPNNQVIDIVAPSHRAYPGQIAGENFEIWSIDIPSNAGYNPQSSGVYFPATGTNHDSYTGRMGGTSAACPQVAAAAALLLSLNPNLTQQQVFNLLTQNADKVGGYTYNASGFSNELGYGRLNLYRAVLKAGADLYIKDQITDSGLEPNPSTGRYFVSPDIWVRKTNDGIERHQNPEAGQTNYVYVKVRNRGSLSSGFFGNRLKLYWASASAGLGWNYPWIGDRYLCNGNIVPIGGQIGSTRTIPPIAAGGFTTMVFEWNPPKPSAYPCFTDASHFCLLARIETRTASPFGMAFPETTDLYWNVRNNNNIAWKNVTVVNLLPDMLMVRSSILITGAKLLGRSFNTTNIAFQVPNEKGNNNILDVATVDLDLGVFTDAWLKAGGRVDSGRLIKYQNGKRVIRVLARKGIIYGVPIASTQLGSITVNVTPVKFTPNKLFLFDVLQLDKYGEIGGERFDIQFTEDKKQIVNSTAPAAAAKQPAPKENPHLKVYQTGKQLNIQVNDGKEYRVTVVNSLGQIIATATMINQKTIAVDNYRQGIYFIRLNALKEAKTYTTTVRIQ